MHVTPPAAPRSEAGTLRKVIGNHSRPRKIRSKGKPLANDSTSDHSGQLLTTI